MRPHGKMILVNLDIQHELQLLPATLGAAPPEDDPAKAGQAPLQILSKQGRMVMRLTASVDALTTRHDALAQQLTERNEEFERLEQRYDAAQRQAQQASMAAIQILDALDWAHGALSASNDPRAKDLEAAQRDSLRRLAAAGINEIPCEGEIDGKLHEAMESVATEDVSRYHIVRVIRRGFQSGTEILRRAGVVTAM